jgi:hypothetical protein
LTVVVLICDLKVYAAAGMTGRGVGDSKRRREERTIEMPNLKDAGGPQAGLT